MKWVPKITFDEGTVAFRWAQRPWTQGAKRVGGYDETAGGLPVGYTIHRRQYLRCLLRVDEDQILSLFGFVKFQQDNPSVPFLLELDSIEAPGQGVLCYMDSYQREGEDFEPERFEKNGKFEIPFVFRSVDDAPWQEIYFDLLV